MTRIVTAKEQLSLLAPWMKESATPMVTLFSKPNCPACTQTKRRLDDAGVEHIVRDVTVDPEAHAFVTNLGYSAAPVVHAGDDNHWSGFKPDRIKALGG